jgi:FtsZ-binding cell division protein ZapB
MIKTTEDIIDDLKDKAKEAIDTLYQVLADLTIIEDNYKELEYKNSNLASNNSELKNELDTLKESKGEPLDTLREIIGKAEDYDCGLKGWRTLETKQDLIDAIKKEVL